MESQKPNQSKFKPFPWGKIRHIPQEQHLPLPEVVVPGYPDPHRLDAKEFEEVIRKAEGLCVRPDLDFGGQLSVVLWAKKCLEKQSLIPHSHKIEFVCRIKCAARKAIKMMREAGEDPILYFPNKLPEYERAFAD